IHCERDYHVKCRSADLGFAFRLSSRLFGNSTRKSVCFHCGRRRFHRGICPSQTRLCALRENIHASALLCEEPLRPLRLNFKSHKVQETFTAEDAEDFAEARRGTLRAKRVARNENK